MNKETIKWSSTMLGPTAKTKVSKVVTDFKRWLISGSCSGDVASPPEMPIMLGKAVSEKGVSSVLDLIYRSGRAVTGAIALASIAQLDIDRGKLTDYSSAIMRDSEALFAFCWATEQLGSWPRTARAVVETWYNSAAPKALLEPRTETSFPDWTHQRVLTTVHPKVHPDKAWLVTWLLGRADMEDPKADETILAAARIREPMLIKLRIGLMIRYGLPISALPPKKQESKKFWRMAIEHGLVTDADVLEHLDRLIAKGLLDEALAAAGTRDRVGLTPRDTLALARLWALRPQERYALERLATGSLSMLVPKGGLGGQLVIGSRSEFALALVSSLARGYYLVRRSGTLGKIADPRSFSEWATITASISEEPVDLELLTKKNKGTNIGTLVLGQVKGDWPTAQGELVVLGSQHDGAWISSPNLGLAELLTARAFLGGV